MKKIKVKFCDFTTKDKLASANFILDILRRNYEVEFSEEPEYLFFHESTYSHLNYKNCIKIFYTLENIHPNFNFCDYAISFDYLDFGDRHYRLPFHLVAPFYFASKEDIESAGDPLFKDIKPFTKAELEAKKGFCSFVYGNYLADPTREFFFNKLSQYKKINSGGALFNNVGGRVSSKLQFERKHKFSIAFENSSRPGYTTEKIVNALAARTIPIYWGDPEINKEFNEKRFINCHNYSNFDEVIERIREIDNNDDLYLEIINEKPTIPSYDFQSIIDDFETFLKNIIEQPLESAVRLKINPARYADLVRKEMMIRKQAKVMGSLKEFIAYLYRPFKKIPFLERLKVIYFTKKNKI